MPLLSSHDKQASLKVFEDKQTGCMVTGEDVPTHPPVIPPNPLQTLLYRLIFLSKMEAVLLCAQSAITGLFSVPLVILGCNRGVSSHLWSQDGSRRTAEEQ